MLNEFFGGIPLQLVVSVAGVAIMIGVAALMGGSPPRRARPRQRPGSADGGQRSARMTPAFLRYAIVLIAAAGMGVLSAPVGTFGQEHECPVPERFYTSEPLLTKTAKALTGGQEVVIAVLGGASTVGLAAAGPGLAWPARLSSARREIPIRAHQSRQPCRGTPDGEGAAERLVRDVLSLKPTW